MDLAAAVVKTAATADAADWATWSVGVKGLTMRMAGGAEHAAQAEPVMTRVPVWSWHLHHVPCRSTTAVVGVRSGGHPACCTGEKTGGSRADADALLAALAASTAAAHRPAAEAHASTASQRPAGQARMPVPLGCLCQARGPGCHTDAGAETGRVVGPAHC